VELLLVVQVAVAQAVILVERLELAVVAQVLLEIQTELLELPTQVAVAVVHAIVLAVVVVAVQAVLAL
jgi:hypothetical protein